MSIKAQLETLSAERENARKEAKELLATAEKDGLTDDLSAKIDDLTAKATTADEKITELLERDNAIKARLEQLNGFADHSKAIEGARGVNVSSQPTGDAQPKTKIPATVRRYSKLVNFAGEINGIRPEERAYRFGQYAMAKLTADMPGKFHFRHAMQFARDQFGFQPMAVHGEGGSDTTGSHVFVPDEFGTDLIRLRELYGVARGVLRVRTMTSDTRTDPRRTGGLTAYFVGENSAGTESDASYDNVSLTAKKLMAITRMSNELSEDSVIDFGDELAGEISYAFANKEDECAFNGDGTSTYGGITGIRNRLDTLTAGTAPGLILGAGNAWSELTLANFESVVGALPQYADVPGQVSWVCHKTFAWTVMKRLALAAGGNTADDITNGPGMSFLGYPVRISQVFPSSEANSQIPVVFGNYSMCGSMGDRRQETISFSDQATVGGQSLWERDQMAVKGTQRFDINIHDFGSNTAAGPICGLETASS